MNRGAGPAPAPARARRARLPFPVVLLLLAAAVVVTATAGIAIGSVSVPAGQVWGILAHQVHPGLAEATWSPVRETIVLDVRLPRVLVLVLNITVFGLVTLPVAAFAGALAALVAVYFLARSGGRMTTLRLVLAGVAMAEVLSALASFLIVTSNDPHKTQSALRWMLGGLAGTTWSMLWIPAVVVLAGTAVLLGVSRPLNLLLSGEEAATALGLDVHRFRASMFTVVALMIGTMVAVSGQIGFVGLIMPHVVRLLVGADHRRALPAAALLGAAFLIAADLAARTLMSPEEVPVGILTALVGGPFFLWLMRRRTT
ncbi:FecCD family ABC transporter permease [Streptomyces sp. NPDC002454]